MTYLQVISPMLISFVIFFAAYCMAQSTSSVVCKINSPKFMEYNKIKINQTIWMIPQNLQSFLQPKKLNIQNEVESSKYRPKTSSSHSNVQQPFSHQNFNVIYNRKTGDRSMSQPRTATKVARRKVLKYFNGGSDAMSVELRRPITHQSDRKSLESRSVKQNTEARVQIFEQAGIGSGLGLPQMEIKAKKFEATPIQTTQTEQFSEQKSETNCFEFDYAFLEQLQANDPLVCKLLQDLNIEDQNVDIEKIVMQNQDYFHHIFANCACFKCICGLCKCNYALCKMSYRNGFKTVYNKEFEKQQNIIELKNSGSNNQQYNGSPNLCQTHYDTLNQVQPQKNGQDAFLTTHQVSKNCTLNLELLLTASFTKTIQTTLLANSFSSIHGFNNLQGIIHIQRSIKKNFIDWQDYDPSWKFRRPDHLSVQQNMPFMNSTVYATDFSVKKKGDANYSVDDVKELQNQYFYPHQQYKKQNLFKKLS